MLITPPWILDIMYLSNRYKVTAKSENSKEYTLYLDLVGDDDISTGNRPITVYVNEFVYPKYKVGQELMFALYDPLAPRASK